MFGEVGEVRPTGPQEPAGALDRSTGPLDELGTALRAGSAMPLHEEFPQIGDLGI